MPIDYKALGVLPPQDIPIFRGDDKDPVFSVTDANGATVDLTGGTITFRVRPYIGGASSFVKTVGSGITISTDPNYQFTVTIDPGDTSGLDYGDYRWDAELTLSGAVTTVAWGKLIIFGDIA